jgi:arylsulfatase A-like enzyme
MRRAIVAVGLAAASAVAVYATDATWHYTEYANGGRELYNLTRDPQRLKNLARLPRQKDRVRQLHRLLHRQVVRPDGVVLS